MSRRLAMGIAVGSALVVAAALGTPAALASNSNTPAPAAQSGPPAVGLSTLGATGWKVLTSATATQGGAAISAPTFNTNGWLSVKPDDAGAPGTEINALLQNGACPNVFYANNMQKCFGYEGSVGKETVPQFMKPWWFRTNFAPNLRAGQAASLIVNGIMGQADVWVNGHEVATQDTVTGDFTKFTFDVTKLLQPGNNSLALEVYPNDVNTMFTLGDEDWEEVPPDNNTGIQFPVQLQVANALTDGNAHVNQVNAPDLASSALTVDTDITNNSAASQTGTVTASILPPGGGLPIVVNQSVTVAAHATKTVTFAPSAYPRLQIAHPKIWWPYQMGAQPLYTLDTAVSQNGLVSNSTDETFGIRTVTSSLIDPSPAAPQGVRSYSVNGKAFVARGGGYDEDIFLRYAKQDVAHQIALMRNLGINMIRLEGHIMPNDFYQQMDRAGMMIDSGWECCDNTWQPTSPPTQKDLDIMALSALTVGQNQRNHPSVVTFSWSDNAPVPTQEDVSLKAFKQADFNVPIVSSAEYNSSPQLGASGEKEGPYDWVSPSYWYDSGTYDPTDPTRTNVGGSWGFDSEQSGGDTVPTLDSIQRFLSPSDQSNLWQDPSYHQYHANYETGIGGYAFGTLYDFDTAMSNRYGQWNSLNSYVHEAQVAEYENTRSQFEAFIDHSTNKNAPSTGTIYWQLNKGWPTLLWDLYNNDGDQPGAYFGAKKANESLHALYTYDNNTVTLDNLGGANQSGLSVEAKVYDTSGTVLDDQTANGINLGSQGVKNSVLTPKVPAATAPPAKASTYFVELLVRQHGQVVDRNVYWRSTQADVVDWAKTLGNPQATMDQYANMQGLQSLAPAKVKVVAATSAQPGPNGADSVTRVTITNTSNTPAVGFFLRADVRKGDAAGTPLAGDNQVASALWNDNDITLWPGESETLSATYKSSDLGGARPVVSVSGWNTGTVDVAAPATPGGCAAQQAAANAPGVLHIGIVDGVKE
ncbi:MAG TPA: beta-mannosidase [Pseudonocardiaceae bacterium]|nr:beta-mannosidase [Pseudonocardiaceae bacterium]